MATKRTPFQDKVRKTVWLPKWQAQKLDEEGEYSREIEDALNQMDRKYRKPKDWDERRK